MASSIWASKHLEYRIRLVSSYVISIFPTYKTIEYTNSSWYRIYFEITAVQNYIIE